MAASSALNPGSGRGFRRALGAGLARGGPLPGLPEKAFKSGGGTWWLGDQWAAWRGLLLRVSPDHGWCEPSQIRSLSPGRSLSRPQAAADTLRPDVPPGGKEWRTSHLRVVSFLGQKILGTRYQGHFHVTLPVVVDETDFFSSKCILESFPLYFLFSSLSFWLL